MILIFIFLIIIYLIFVYKHISEIHKFNHEATIEQLQNINTELFIEKTKERKPLLIYNLGNNNNTWLNLSFDKIVLDNPGLIIKDKNKYISLKSFTDKDIKQIHIYRNDELHEILELRKDFDELYNIFISQIHCNVKYYLNLFRGLNSIKLTKNKNNLLLIHQIKGESKLYLFNPKHEINIVNKNNDEIKKYGHKILLKPGTIIYIPIEWLYFYECDNECIMGEILSDNYFTYFYNSLR